VEELGRDQDERDTERVRRGLNQLLPYSFSTYDWNVRCTNVNYIAQNLSWVCSMIVEINSFFQMNLLEIPPGHPWCLARQVFLALLAVPGQAEYYEASRRDFTVGRFGQNFWLMWMVMVTEVLCTVKHILASPAMYARFQTPPSVVIWSWGGFFLLQVVYLLLHWLMRGKIQRGKPYPMLLRILTHASFVPLVPLFQFYAF